VRRSGRDYAAIGCSRLVLVVLLVVLLAVLLLVLLEPAC
jgi:hypothetical protein